MALICDSTIDPATLPRLPVFGNQANTWSVAIKGEGRPFDETQELVKRIFVSWTTLFPDGTAISEPMVFRNVTREPMTIPDPPLQVAGIADLFGVRFNYLGPDAEIRWPTYVQRRRERIDPLCPLTEVDATVAAIARPLPLDPHRPLFEAPRPITDDPLDLGLGPITPPKWSTVAVVSMALGTVAAAVLLSRSGK